MIRRAIFFSVLISFSAMFFVAAEVRAATPREIEISITRAKAWLYGQQKNGNWEEVQDVPKPFADDFSEVKGKQWGGMTALATYALLAAGESPQDKRLAPAIEFLQKHLDDMNGVYAVGMRCQVWPFLAQNAETKRCAKRDATFLQEAIIRQSKDKGYYDYLRAVQTGNSRWDRSVSQYGVLGMWACDQSGIEVPGGYWQLVEDAWKRGQKSDGAWSYNDVPQHPDTFNPTPSMTAAGIATLFITQDYLHGNDGITCKGNVSNQAIDKGMEWMTKNFPTDLSKTRDWIYYLLYGIERIGVASGYKYFGTIDWYKFGSDYIISKQYPEGYWANSGTLVPNTSWCILFLVRGRAPVVMNKLQYDVQAADAKTAVGRWNQRPRDAANLSRWIGTQSERWLNWQIVNLNVPIEELHDSPILYIAGDQKLSLKDADVAKLKQFIEQGGLILANADCGNKDFSESFRKLGKKMFADYEFRELPANHPIYTEEQFLRAKWKTPPSVLGLSNGAREFMILLPTADAGKAWQMRDNRGKADVFQLGANIFLYAVEKQDLQEKGKNHLIALDAKITAGKTMKVARLEYAGNWDPEPGGWLRMANLMHNQNKIDIKVESIKLGEKKLTKDFKVAHLTGTGAFKLTPDQQAEIKTYLDGGGTLIVDSAGGATAFTTSAEAELAAIAPEAKQPYAAIPAANPMAAKMKDLSLRKFAIKSMGSSKATLPKAIEIKGRPAIFFSPLDLSVGIVGQPVDGIVGYDPASSTTIMSTLLTYIAEH